MSSFYSRNQIQEMDSISAAGAVKLGHYLVSPPDAINGTPYPTADNSNVFSAKGSDTITVQDSTRSAVVVFSPQICARSTGRINAFMYERDQSGSVVKQHSISLSRELDRSYATVGILSHVLRGSNESGDNDRSGNIFGAVLTTSTKNLHELTPTDLMVSAREGAKKVNREEDIVTLAIPREFGSAQYHLKTEPTSANGIFTNSGSEYHHTVMAIQNSVGASEVYVPGFSSGEMTSEVTTAGSSATFFNSQTFVNSAASTASVKAPDFCFTVKINANISVSAKVDSAVSGAATEIRSLAIKVQLLNFAGEIISDVGDPAAAYLLGAGGYSTPTQLGGEEQVVYLSGSGVMSASVPIAAVRLQLVAKSDSATGLGAGDFVKFIGGTITIDKITNDSDIPTAPCSVLIFDGLRGGSDVLSLSASALLLCTVNAETSEIVANGAARDPESIVDLDIVTKYMQSIALLAPSTFIGMEYDSFVASIDSLMSDEEGFDALSFRKLRRIGRKVKNAARSGLKVVNKAGQVLERVEPALRIAGMAGVPGAAQLSQVRGQVEDAADAARLGLNLAGVNAMTYPNGKRPMYGRPYRPKGY